MAGNVWEWTRSMWGEARDRPEFTYPYVPTDGRENVEAPANVPRVVRGGAFYGHEGGVRCALRDWNFPDNGHGSIGFRVVLSP